MNSVLTKYLVVLLPLSLLTSCHGGTTGSKDVIPPTIPTNLTALSISSGAVFLEWTTSTDDTAVAGYKLYRDGNYVNSTQMSAVEDTGLNASTQYCYTVTAYDAAGNETAKSNQACAKTWMISILDNAGAVGIAPSIARDSSDNLHVSYYDITNDAVKYISNATGTWVASTISHTIGNVAGNLSTAIAVDSTDKIHISYGSYTASRLMYATISSGTWTTSTVDTGTIRQTSIATDSNNKVHISYYDQATAAFKCATNASGSWAITTIDTISAAGNGGSSSITVDSNDKVHISYVGSYRGPYNDLMYATNASGIWTTSLIDAGSVDNVSVIGLARDSNDKIHISYYNAIDNQLNYATNATGAWVMSTLDGAYGGIISSVAIDSNNNVHFIYSSNDVFGSYINYATIFKDGWIGSVLDSVGVMGFYCAITTDSNDKLHVIYWDGIFNNQDLKYATNQ